ncbi:MAG: hypothetical protein ACTSUO_03645 [Candidatus Thorarchaeota archaeon]
MMDDIIFADKPPYDSVFIRAIAFAMAFVMAPVFLIIMFTEPNFALLVGLVWLFIPIFVISIPYLLVVPADITLTQKAIRVKHGVWSITIPLDQIEQCDVIQYPPWWANFQHYYPNAQWIQIAKSKGRLNWWYIPTTNATQLVLAIRRAQGG